jgi:5-methylcytosine-specific restriction protein A
VEEVAVPSRRVCTRPGCPRFTADGGRCGDCRRSADLERGTASQRGYTSRGHRLFRTAVLDRDPICVGCDIAAATVADHWPYSRRELITSGRNPDDPRFGRGLCKRCHDRSTAQAQPGGWNDR